jgi:hypothetical protein
MNINEMIKNQKVLQSNTSGPFVIIKNLGKINGRCRVLIKFINSGSVCNVISYNAVNGRVADPTINGFSNDYDISRYENYESHIADLLKVVYHHMMSRCYNQNDPKYNSYGLLGVSVCERWRNDINAFLYDCREIDGYHKYYNRPYLYQLDKDYKQLSLPKNIRIYSKDTCTFLYHQDNSNLKSIERKRGSQFKYYGIEINSAGNFYARIKVRGIRINIGTFNNVIAAANAFNFMQLKYHDYELVPLLNDVPYMTPDEFIKYNVNPKEICISV